MNVDECCDLYCTTCRIYFLRVLRPGDTVPFRKPKHILPLGVVEGMLAFVIIVLDSLAIFNQSQGYTSPSPSFIGSPGIPIWLSTIIIADGCTKISAFKRKTRFSTAIAFGASVTTIFIVVALLAIVTMAVSEEMAFQRTYGGPSGVAVAAMLCLLVVILLFVTSASALLCYLALTSHDDRWFTDRGTQHDPLAPDNGSTSSAHLSVPSGQPAFLFYAPSSEAKKYSAAFNDVITGLEAGKIGQSENVQEREEYYEETIDGRKTADANEACETFVATAPPSACRTKTIHDGYLNSSIND